MLVQKIKKEHRNIIASVVETGLWLLLTFWLIELWQPGSLAGLVNFSAMVICLILLLVLALAWPPQSGVPIHLLVLIALIAIIWSVPDTAILWKITAIIACSISLTLINLKNA